MPQLDLIIVTTRASHNQAEDIHFFLIYKTKKLSFILYHIGLLEIFQIPIYF